MENVLEDLKPSINLSQFLEKYKSLLNTSSEAENVPFYFADYSPVSADVEASCSLQQLFAADDNAVNVFDPGTEIVRYSAVKPHGEKVPKTYTAITEHKAKSRRNPFARTQYSYRLVTESTTTTESDLAKMWEVEQYDLEITVRFYRPPRASYRGYKVERPVFAEEFVCLGSNYLTELRDKISCICNGKQFVDISEDPEAPLPVLETDPGYFFINGTFYNDTRNPNNCDYSETVTEWARKALGVDHEEFQCASMETTRFLDLAVTLGAPLQYLHHGNCEHLFVFSQVEVLRPHMLCRNQYPFVRAVNTYNRRTCYMCGLRGYNFIVEQSRRQLHDPSYLCRHCFYSFNYVDGKRVGEFKAYRIYDLPDRPDDEVDGQPKQRLDIRTQDSEDSNQ